MHTLPKLGYDYQALEPFIDAKTMEIHYTKHHQTYVDKLNAGLAKFPDLEKKSLEELLRDIESLPPEIKTVVQNHGGGHHNHSLFWQILTPKSTGKPTGALLQEIEKTWESFSNFSEKFTASAVGHFGSGWVWLNVSPKKELWIETSVNQNSPLMHGFTPILGLDLWEHAYYLKYQNRRPEYVQAFWNIVDWAEVERRYAEAMK